MSQFWSDILVIVGMTVITYGIRSAVFVLGHRLRFSRTIRTALSFVPVTVLTAIISPMIIAPYGGNAEWSWHNAQLGAAGVALLVGLTMRKPLLTIALSLVVFFVWQMVAN